MKAILLCNGSANQRALAHRLNEIVPLTAIGQIDPLATARRRNWPARLTAISIAYPLRAAWFGMLAHFDRLYPSFPNCQLSRHAGVNSGGVIEMILAIGPDIVLVSGTDLLRQPLIDAVHRTGRVMNLHTGISPYVKGGPNCTNWALSLGRFDLIGNSIMWLDSGIDSGNLVASERTSLNGCESLLDLHIKVMNHAHDLYGRCLAGLRDGRPLASVPQESIDPGRLFLTRHWTSRAMVRAIWNFKRRYDRGGSKGAANVELVGAPYQAGSLP